MDSFEQDKKIRALFPELEEDGDEDFEEEYLSEEYDLKIHSLNILFGFGILATIIVCYVAYILAN